MATSKKQEKDIHVANNNRNVNNNTVNVNVELPKIEEPQKKKSTSWLLKSIVGGIITIAIALIIYYGQKKIDNTNSIPTEPAIGIKQTNN